LNIWGVIAVAVMVILALTVIWLTGRICINFYYIRDNTKELAKLEIRGWGFAYRYQTKPSLWLSQYYTKHFYGKKGASPASSATEEADVKPGESGKKWEVPTSDALQYFNHALGAFLEYSRWKRVKVSLSWGTGDAASTAVTIGIARSVGAYVWLWLKRHLNFTHDPPLLEFYPYYNDPKISANMAVECQIRLFRLLWIAFILIYNLKIRK